MAEANKIHEQRDVLEDGTMVEVTVYRIEDNEHYPSGYKYSFQHWDPETGETLL